MKTHALALRLGCWKMCEIRYTVKTKYFHSSSRSKAIHGQPTIPLDAGLGCTPSSGLKQHARPADVHRRPFVPIGAVILPAAQRRLNGKSLGSRGLSHALKPSMGLMPLERR